MTAAAQIDPTIDEIVLHEDRCALRTYDPDTKCNCDRVYLRRTGDGGWHWTSTRRYERRHA